MVMKDYVYQPKKKVMILGGVLITNIGFLFNLKP